MIEFIANLLIVYCVAEVAAVIAYMILEPENIIPGYDKYKSDKKQA